MIRFKIHDNQIIKLKLHQTELKRQTERLNKALAKTQHHLELIISKI